MERPNPQNFSITLLLWLLTVCGAPVLADPGPHVLLHEMTDSVLAEIRKDPARLEDVDFVRALADRFIMPHVDFRAAAQWALGKYWRTASAQQRERFVAQFRQLLLNTYLRSISNYREQEIRINPAHGQLERGRAQVDTEIERPGGPPVHVNFRLHRPGSDWLIYDISVEGVSLVATHRSSFAKEIDNSGLDSLIDRLASLNADKAAGNATGESPARPQP